MSIVTNVAVSPVSFVFQKQADNGTYLFFFHSLNLAI
jgi:hypothetical protein